MDDLFSIGTARPTPSPTTPVAILGPAASWVAYIPASQLPLEYHDAEAIMGVGVEAFRGSPQLR